MNPELKNPAVNNETPTQTADRIAKATGFKGFQTGVGVISGDALSSASLAPEPKLDIRTEDTTITTPSVQDFQTDSRISSENSVKANDLAAQAQQQSAELGASTANAFDDYLNRVLSAPTFSELQAEQYKQKGVDEKQLQVDKLNTQLLAEQDSLRTKIEKIESRGGGLKMGAQAEISNLERESIAKQADIALLQLAAQDQLDYATRVADRAVNAMFEREERITQVMKDVYDRNKELFTTAEQRAFDIAMSDRERELEAKKDAEKMLRDTQIESMKMLQLNDAPQSVVDAVMSAKTPQEVIKIAGEAGLVDVELRKLERQIQNQTLANAYKQGRKADYELAQLVAAEERRKKAIEAGELLPEQFEVADEYDQDFRDEPIVKEFNEAASKRYAFEQIVTKDESLGVQDLFLVYEFMKAIDPTSVVRESEFDNAAKTGNIFQGQYAKFSGYFTEGQRLPPEVRNAFINSANASWSGKQQQYFNVKEQFGEKINRQLGIDNGANYLTSYEDAAPLDQASSIEKAKPGQVIVQNGIKFLVQSDGTYKQLTD